MIIMDMAFECFQKRSKMKNNRNSMKELKQITNDLMEKKLGKE
jgi:hypothetical protein